jgi:hypothetical protein
MKSRPCCSPNQLRGSAPCLIEFYARRMLIETSIADFLPHRCLILRRSSQNQLRSAADPHGQFPLPPARLTNRQGLHHRALQPPVRDFVEAQVRVTITDISVKDTFGKRAHSPLLRAAGAQDTDAAVPWWPET